MALPTDVSMKTIPRCLMAVAMTTSIERATA